MAGGSISDKRAKKSTVINNHCSTVDDTCVLSGGASGHSTHYPRGATPRSTPSRSENEARANRAVERDDMKSCAPILLLACALFAASPRHHVAHASDLWCGEHNCYEVLGLLPNATAGEVKKAYFKQSLKWHPDKNPSLEAKNEFAKLAGAYEILSEPRRREVRDGHYPGETGARKESAMLRRIKALLRHSNLRLVFSRSCLY